MTTAQKTKSNRNEQLIKLLGAVGPGHCIRVSGASSLMVYEGRDLAAELQLGEPITVSAWLTFRVGSESDSLDNPALHEAGESKLEALLPTWDAHGFTRSNDEYVDLMNPDDPRVVFVARLDASRETFDESVELVTWALDQERTFDAMEGADAC
jgi:hypothetical protein